MNKALKPFLLAAVLAAVSFSASATQLIINDDECVLELAPGQAVSIDPASGDVRARVTNLEECMGSVEPPEVIFSRSPSSLEVGQQVTLTWNSSGASECQAGGNLSGWSGIKQVQGSQSITVNSAGSYTVSLSCTGPGGTTGPISRSVTVTTGPEPGGCSDRPWPSGMSRATNGRMTTGTQSGQTCTGCGNRWQPMFDFSFPGGNEAWYYQQRNQFHALEFNTGSMSPNAFGQIGFGEPHSTMSFYGIKNGRRFVTISECPGDFHKSKLATSCFRDVNGIGNVQWGGSANTQLSRCTLQPNTTYYLNIVHVSSTADVNNPSPAWACTGEQPGFTLLGCGSLTKPN